jgi:hypothetical protein
MTSRLTVTRRYGAFTVNFKPVPPPIPPEYWTHHHGYYYHHNRMVHTEYCFLIDARLHKGY